MLLIRKYFEANRTRLEIVKEILEDDCELEKEENTVLRRQMNIFKDNQLKRMNL